MNTLDVISLMHSLGAKSCISNLKRIGNFLTKIAPTQQGAVTEQSLALQLEALKEETTPLLRMLQRIQAMLWGKNNSSSHQILNIPRISLPETLKWTK